MQGAAREARQVNGPPTWLSRLPKGTSNEFRVVEREERSRTTAGYLFLKGKNTHACAHAGRYVATEATKWTYGGKSLVSSTEGSTDEGRAKLKLPLGCINEEKYKACKKQSVVLP